MDMDKTDMGAGSSDIGCGDNFRAFDDDPEITPEMIRAGLRAYRTRDSRVMSDADIVEDIIYEALVAGSVTPTRSPVAK